MSPASTTKTYNAPHVHGLGLSSSSCEFVIRAACHAYIKCGVPLSSARVALAALRMERGQAGGVALAAIDVYPITYGGVCMLHTAPGAHDFGHVSVVPISADPTWLGDHVVVAFNPRGKRHEVPSLLRRLVTHSSARARVERFSRLAAEAGAAIVNQDIRALASAVNNYRLEFDRWTTAAFDKPIFTLPVRRIATALVAALPHDVLGWKPPGGGACEALIVISRCDLGARRVIEYLASAGWTAIPADVTGGVDVQVTCPAVRITAGHRLDFIGAADLGQDPHISAAGVCCSAAIAPRSELLLV
ncbi:MAG: hypothetical protein AB7U20_14385 [Planctomycetaceae bacterium]